MTSSSRRREGEAGSRRKGDRQDVPHEFMPEGFSNSAMASVAVDPTIGEPMVFTESENLS
jgi:hypothetical protein